MTNNIKDWSTTPASNDIADAGINWQEGMAPSSVNNSARGMMSAIKSWWDESLGGISAYAADTGEADVYAIAPAPTITAYATGQAFHFFAANANTGVSTVNVNALGPKAVQKNGAALVSGDIVAGGLVQLVYDGTQFQMPSITSGLTLMDLTVDVDTLYVDSTNDRVGVGTANPDCKLHVRSATNGHVWSPNGATFALFEGAVNSYVGIVGGNAGLASLNFGDTAAEIRGSVKYNNNGDALTLVTALVDRVIIGSGGLDIVTGALKIAGNTTLPVNQLITISANDLDHTADELLIWDDSASAHRKIGLDDFGIKVVAQTSAKTFALADANTMQESTSAAAVIWTVPPNSAVNFSIGTVIQVFQSGAGQVTIAPGAAVLLRAPNGLKTSQQYAVMCIVKVASDTWVAYGDVAV